MTTNETDILFAKLEAVGWQREGDRLIAPRGTMWLYYHELWPGTGQDMQERMHGRLERILANRHVSSKIDAEAWQRSYDDTFSLVRCLDHLFG